MIQGIVNKAHTYLISYKGNQSPNPQALLKETRRPPYIRKELSLGERGHKCKIFPNKNIRMRFLPTINVENDTIDTRTEDTEEVYSNVGKVIGIVRNKDERMSQC